MKIYDFLSAAYGRHRNLKEHKLFLRLPEHRQLYRVTNVGDTLVDLLSEDLHYKCITRGNPMSVDYVTYNGSVVMSKTVLHLKRPVE